MTMTDKELADELLTLADYIERGDGSGDLVFVPAEIRNTREAAERLNQLSARVVQAERERDVWRNTAGENAAETHAQLCAVTRAESALAAERATRGELIAAETEGCAKIADQWTRSNEHHRPGEVGAGIAHDVSRRIAESIRARTIHSPEGKQP